MGSTGFPFLPPRMTSNTLHSDVNWDEVWVANTPARKHVET